MELTSEDVRDILQLLDGLPYRELTLETASFRLSLRRDADGEWTQATEVLAEPVAPGWAGPDAPAAAPIAPPADRADDGVAEHGVAEHGVAEHGVAEHGLADIRAPLLGTFYRAPRPGAPPFVTVGSEVATDTVVCIIETMKLMNSVSAGVAGIVAEILLENAEFAPQGTVLMRVRPGAPQ